MATTLDKMSVKPLSDTLGAEVSGIDAAELDDVTFDRLRDIVCASLLAIHQYYCFTEREIASKLAPTVGRRDRAVTASATTSPARCSRHRRAWEYRERSELARDW